MAKAYKQDGNALQIGWKDRGAYLDVLPQRFFVHECDSKAVAHAMVDRRGRTMTAKCTLSVAASRALLDYRGLNRGSKVDDGVLLIHFTDASRSGIRRIEFKYKTGPVPAEYWVWETSDGVVEGKRYLAEIQRLTRNQAIANQCKRRDNFTCQVCGMWLVVERKCIADCHHIAPLSQKGKDNKKITCVDDLVTLCPTCHRIAHTQTEPLDVAAIKRIRQDLTSVLARSPRRAP